MGGPAKEQANPGDPFFFQYQHLLFDADGSFRSITSQKPIEPWLYKSLVEGAPKVKKYEIQKANGGNLLKLKGPDGDEYQLCILIIKDGRNTKTGDVVLTYWDANQNLYLSRHIRK